MKVIFKQDIRSVAKKYDVKDVADGYALNFLFPNNLAEMATEKSLSKVEDLQKARMQELKVQEDLLHKNIESLKEVTLEFKVKTNEQGHLFASIHKDDLVEELSKQARIEMNPDFIVLDKPIKEAGDHEVKVVVKGTESHFMVKVESL